MPRRYRRLQAGRRWCRGAVRARNPPWSRKKTSIGSNPNKCAGATTMGTGTDTGTAGTGAGTAATGAGATTGIAAIGAGTTGTGATGRMRARGREIPALIVFEVSKTVKQNPAWGGVLPKQVLIVVVKSRGSVPRARSCPPGRRGPAPPRAERARPPLARPRQLHWAGIRHTDRDGNRVRSHRRRSRCQSLRPWWQRVLPQKNTSCLLPSFCVLGPRRGAR